MNIEDLHDLLAGAPTGGAESSALAVLTGLARNGDLAATRTLLAGAGLSVTKPRIECQRERLSGT